MKTEAQGIDKSGWGNGPWQSEPDHEEFERAGFPCMIHRQPTLGHLCGYVAVPPGHPWHGKNYDGIEVEVHGGITYANKCAGAICHVPKPGEPADVWWLGFDFAHLGDVSPATDAHLIAMGHTPYHGSGRGHYDSYKTIEFVREECMRFAEQARRAS